MNRYLVPSVIATVLSLGTASAQDPCQPTCIADLLPTADVAGAAAGATAGSSMLVLATGGALAAGIALATLQREIADPPR